MLYLVRHGRTAHNADGRLLGRLDVPLDDLGRRQAVALGQVPALRGASRVISSPLARAVDTASAIGPPVEVDGRWAEIDYGELDGVALGDAGGLFEEWERDLVLFPPGGQSILDLGVRVRAACESIWDEAASSDVVVAEPRLTHQGGRGVGAGGARRHLLADVPLRGLRLGDRVRQEEGLHCAATTR